MTRIEEAFSNLAQVIEGERAVMTNLSGATMNLTTQVDIYTNHLETKE